MLWCRHHYTCKILIEGNWFHYDGLGNPSLQKSSLADASRDFNPTYCMYGKDMVNTFLTNSN